MRRPPVCALDRRLPYVRKIPDLCGSDRYQCAGECASVVDFASCISRHALACGSLYPDNFRAASRRTDPCPRYSKARQRLNPALAGRLVSELRDIADMVSPAPDVDVSPGPYDNYLLAMASAGRANSLITGDKRDLLLLKKYQATAIVTVSDFLSGLRHLHQFR
jgi:hypothetical protein